MDIMNDYTLRTLFMNMTYGYYIDPTYGYSICIRSVGTIYGYYLWVISTDPNFC